MMGLEPTTLGTTNRCSNQLSYIYRVGSANVKIYRLKSRDFLILQSPYRLFWNASEFIAEICIYGRAISRVKCYGDALQ